MTEALSPLERIVSGQMGRGAKTLVPFLTAGYPDRQTFAALMAEVAAAGCPLVEIGIPFSDPVADGPVIQAASQQALESGVNLAEVITMAAAARSDHGLGVVLMGYLNPILRFGAERFALACGEAGVVGLIVPDLPREEADRLRKALEVHGVTMIDLVAPTTDPRRLQIFGRESHGFLYLVSSTGVTGKRSSGDIASYIARVRKTCPQPLFVGFGIDGPEAAVDVGLHADGVIIGSAILSLVAGASSQEEAAARVGKFLRDVNGAMSRAFQGRNA